jgi:hypothetical protein
MYVCMHFVVVAVAVAVVVVVVEDLCHNMVVLKYLSINLSFYSSCYISG